MPGNLENRGLGIPEGTPQNGLGTSSGIQAGHGARGKSKGGKEN